MDTSIRTLYECIVYMYVCVCLLTNEISLSFLRVDSGYRTGAQKQYFLFIRRKNVRVFAPFTINCGYNMDNG